MSPVDYTYMRFLEQSKSQKQAGELWLPGDRQWGEWGVIVQLVEDYSFAR